MTQDGVIPLKRGASRKRPCVVVGTQVELRLPAYFRKPWLLDRSEIVGWFPPIEKTPSAFSPVLARLPVLPYFRTGSQFAVPNVHLLFRRPLPLPPLRWSGRLELHISWRKARQEIAVDGVIVAAKDAGQAAQVFVRSGLPRINDPDRAVVEIVGAINDPTEARAVTTVRQRDMARTLRKVRVWTFIAIVGGMARGMFDVGRPLSWALSRLALLTVYVSAGAWLVRWRGRQLRRAFGASETFAEARPRLQRGLAEWVAVLAALLGTFQATLWIHDAGIGPILAYWALWGWAGAGLFYLMGALWLEPDPRDGRGTDLGL